MTYSHYLDNIESLYFDLWPDEKEYGDGTGQKEDGTMQCPSVFFKQIAQEFADVLGLFLEKSKRSNKAICLPSFGKFKENRYFMRMVQILQCCAERECIILCGYLLRIFWTTTKPFRWNKKAVLYFQDCVNFSIRCSSYKDHGLSRHIQAICDLIADS